ncbi:23S rRNA (guanosine(2251)-2'-O)-methyltransferase RlmB [Candidatus Erwinia haradaeae]|uniref:23S rRNA (guanosine-2'-O-)-methyltransferase RlmB n=1 Tax=Candidatus Erwinia haradaeae TaxID=1922217 RepID=A0A451D9F9_9GAMM|nr:23S rRNA (guanosine(2251)-2'-O)-methyltransferase RlmB [Candidatus Erwinia haradaeae]VFP82852.1 23S rRNA (guanosine-2'-O-)-methyltransferase RlmB [Candidatus Erwinia haradaeae]
MSHILFGIHPIQDMLETSPQRIKTVLVIKGYNNIRLQRILQLIKIHDISINIVHRKKLDDQSDGAVHQGIIAYVQPKQQFQEEHLLILLSKINNPLLLILDGITDPHNLGACIRSAYAAGAHAILLPKNHSAKLNSTVQKVASSSAEHIPLVYVTNLARTIRILKQQNIWIIGTTDKATCTLYQSNMTGPIALIMGAEDKGIRRLTSEHCNELIYIPMHGNVSSLNVSVATGICLYEAVRQRTPMTLK